VQRVPPFANGTAHRVSRNDGPGITEMSTNTHHSRRTLRLASLLGVLVTTALGSASAQAPAERSVRVFLRVSLFAPLAADPRWPRFTLGYIHYIFRLRRSTSWSRTLPDNGRGSMGAAPSSYAPTRRIWTVGRCREALSFVL